jgi:outer membrane scaffolding protein for murein synthesis (MipA/OmpV family)
MRHFACLALAACLASPAYAQSQPSTPALPSPDELASKDTLTVGLGAAIVPDYEGSDDYRIVPAGAIRGRYHGISFTTRGTYLYVDVMPDRGKVDFDLGPIAGVRMNRRKNIEDDVVKLLPNLKRAIEVGGFAGVSVHGLTNPYDTLSFRLDALFDVGSAHESTVISPTVEFSTPISQTTYVGASVGLEFAGNKYADYYFGITPADSLDTGGLLPVYNPDGGLKNWKMGVLVNQSLSGSLLHGVSLFGLGQYTRLTGDFKRSPVVAQRGSASQWVGALGLAYTW